jgi:hypothetical protein
MPLESLYPTFLVAFEGRPNADSRPVNMAYEFDDRPALRMQSANSRKIAFLTQDAGKRTSLAKVWLLQQRLLDLGREVVVTAITYDARGKHMLYVSERFRDDVFDGARRRGLALAKDAIYVASSISTPRSASVT